jgi:hypothetical protein
MCTVLSADVLIGDVLVDVCKEGELAYPADWELIWRLPNVTN